MELLYLLGCIISLFIQGFFAASELSFISSSTIKLRHRHREGSRRAAKVYQMMLKPERFLTTMLIGINFFLVLGSSLLTFFLIQLHVPKSNFWAMIIFTPLTVIFAESIPKNVGQHFREDFSIWVVDIIIFFEKLFAPAVSVFERITSFVIKLSMGKVRQRSLFVSKEEFKLLVKEIQEQGTIDLGEKEAIEEVFVFTTSKVEDVGMPFKRVVGVDYNDSYETVLETAIISSFTRYPVFKNKQTIGYINIYDLFYNPAAQWQSFIRPILQVGINQKLYDVFSRLKKERQSIALVLKGNNAWGIVTMEDLMREIVTSIVKI